MTSWAGRWRRAASRRAFTLLEILTVLAIMAVMMGVAFGYLKSAGRKLGVSSAASTVETMVRMARDASRSRGVPARVVFDRDTGIVWAGAQQLVGEWHFERDRAGYGNPYNPFGDGMRVEQSAEQRWGAFYLFPTTGRAWLDCGTSTAFDGRLGLLIEAEIMVDALPTAGSMILFKKGGEFALAINSSAELEATVNLDTGKLHATTKGFSLRPDVWWSVGLEYDGEALRIHISGVEQAATTGIGMLMDEPGSSLLISDPEKPFQGAVDEVRFSMLTASSRRELPAGVGFEEDYPALRFDREGCLDIRAMERALKTGTSRGPPPTIELPVEIVVGRASGVTRDRAAIRVGYYGGISRHTLDAPARPRQEEETGEPGETPGEDEK